MRDPAGCGYLMALPASRNGRPSDMRRSRIIQAAVVVAVLAFVGAKALRRVQQRQLSPFALWELRAGTSYAALEKSAYRQTKQHFICNAIVESTRVCEMRVTGITGLVRVLVDPRDKIAAVQFAPDSASPAMREEGRRIAAEWNLIRAGVSTRPQSGDSSATFTRWQSEDGKWTTEMRYGWLGTTPTRVHLRDETAIASIGKSAPLASYVLALNGFIESREVPNLDDVGDVLRTTMFGRATDAANETPTARPPATPVPLCRAEHADPVLLAKPHSLEQFTPSTMALLKRAIPAVFPGARLELGDGTWFVDSAGFSERVDFGRGDFSLVSEGSIVVEVRFPGRNAVAMQRIQDNVPDRLCRAPVQVLFARSNTDGSLAEAHLVNLDHEAIVGEIGATTLTEPDFSGEPGHIRVRYASAYAAPASTAMIAWETVISEVPPRATVRVPLLLLERAADTDESTESFLVITGRPSGGIELATLETRPWGTATRTILVPVDSTGVLLGSRILERLAALQPAR